MSPAFYDNLLKNGDDKFTKWNAYSGIVAAVTGILTLAVQLSAGRALQNWWFGLVPILLIVPVLVVFVGRAWRKVVSVKFENRIAKANHVKLLNYLSEFRSQVGTNSATNIIFALSTVNNIGQRLQKREFAELCEMIVDDLRERIGKNKHSFPEFKKALLHLGLMVIMFERLYFNITMQEIKGLGADMISLDTFKKVELSRQNFVNFLDRFSSFNNELNEHLGRKEFGYYFNIPQQL